jgi:hypothetical protein
VFHPGQRDDEHYKRWCRAVELAKGWAAV